MGLKNKLLMVSSFIFDKDRKNIFTIFKEILLLLKKDRGFVHYFSNLLYKKYCLNIDDFMNRDSFNRIINEYYLPEGQRNSILLNKILFQDFTEQHNFPAPKSLGKIINASYQHKNTRIDITSLNDFKRIIDHLLNSNQSIFIKKYDGEGGDGIYKLQDTLDADVLNKIYSSFNGTNYLIQQTVEQHTFLNQINSKSLNTLRVITYKNKNNEISIASCLLRMGVGSSHLDNVSAGGIYAGYDIYENKLSDKAVSFFTEGGKTYYKHPDTEIVFENIKLPYPEKIIQLVSNLAIKFKNEMIGWDIAYTDEGPVVIEGNDNAHLTMMQVACKGFKNHSIYREVFKPYYFNVSA